MKLLLSEIKNTEQKREPGDIKTLAKSICEEGLLQPLVVNQKNELICGRRRLAAIESLGWADVSVHQVTTSDDVDKLSKAITENIIRKDLTWQEEVEAKEELDRLQREKYGEHKAGGNKEKHMAESAKWTSTKTANLLKEPRRTTETDIRLAKAIKKYPELARKKNKSQALMEFQKIERKTVEKPLPDGKYGVIYADPPWLYSTFQHKDDRATSAAVAHYGTMSIEQLCNLDVQSLADTNCVLFIWTTSPLLEKCFPVINSWGFSYRASFIWDKVKHNVGHYNSVRHEFLLIAIKEKGTPDNIKLFDSVQSIERKKHSEKPDEFYEIIEILYPNRRKLELFHRGTKRQGWAQWGNESIDEFLGNQI